MEPKAAAQAIVEAAYAMPGEIVIKADVGTWDPESVRTFFDGVIAQLKTYKLRLRGIRADQFAFVRLGFQQGSTASSTYKNIPVAVDESADFDTVELVFQKQVR